MPITGIFSAAFSSSSVSRWNLDPMRNSPSIRRPIISAMYCPALLSSLPVLYRIRSYPRCFSSRSSTATARA